MFKIVGSGPYCAVSYDSPTFADLSFYMSEIGLQVSRQDPDEFLKTVPDSKFRYINLVTRFPLRKQICQHLDNTLSLRFSFFGSYIPRLENISSGVFIYPGANIYPSAQIHSDVLIHSGATIPHNTSIGQGSYISGHAGFTGGVKLGKYCWVGADAHIADSITIADNTTLNMRAFVINDITIENTVYNKHIKS